MKQTQRKVLSILLSLAMLCSAVLPTVFAADSRYDDTADHWAEASINRWSEYGVIEGYGDLFNPDNAITRAQMATILSKTLGLTETTENPFSDVSADSWYTPYILRCYKAGIMLGDNGMANPENEITRQEAMTMFCRAFGIKADETANLTSFKDSESVADWALPYVAALINNGIVNGVTSDTIAPADNMSRAALVTILDRAIGQYINTSGEYDLTDKDGIILVTAGDTILKGETSADILITEAVGEKPVTFKDATVTGAVTVQADTKIVNNNSKLPEIDATVEDITVAEDKTTPTKRPSGGSGGSSGSSRPTVSDLTISEEKSITSGTYKNVTITDTVADGEVSLSNVTIQGDLTIKGGGSSSINLDTCTISGKVIMAKEGGEAPRLELTNTPIASVEVKKPAIIEAVDSASSITAIETTASVEIKGENTTVETLTIPETAESAVSVTVTAGNVAKVEAKAETTVTGASNTVGTVIATATVTADSATVQKVEIPETATESVSVTVTGTENVEVEVNTANGAAVTGDNVTVSTTLETVPENVTVGGQAVTHIHKWGEPKENPATCEADGAKTYSCIADGCSEPAEIKTEIIERLGHSYGEWKDTLDEMHTHECANDSTHIEKVPHTWDEGKITTEATCGQEGVKTYTCSACGATETDSVPMTEHIWGEWVKVDNDEHKRVCKNNAEHIEEAAHTPIIDTALDATCTEAGKTDGSHCDVCNSVIVEQTIINPLGHDLTDLEVDETSHWYICTRENCAETTAKEAHTYNTTNCAEVAACTICNYEKAAGEHTWGAWVKADENNHKHTCSSCSETETAAHTWNDGEITTEPTETTEGVKTYTCADCGATKTESVPVVSESQIKFIEKDEQIYLVWEDDEGLVSNTWYYVTSGIDNSSSDYKEWNILYNLNGVTESQSLSYKIEKGTWNNKTELYNLENAIDIIIDGAAPTVSSAGQADGRYLISPAPSAGNGYFYHLKNADGATVVKNYTSTGYIHMSPQEGDVLTVQSVKAEIAADAMSVDITLSPIATVDSITYCEVPTGTAEVDTLDELVAALERGGNVKLMADITSEDWMYISTGPEAYLDLNGYSIDTPVFQVSRGKYLSIDGTTEGSSICYSNGQSSVQAYNYSTLNLDGGSYEGIDMWGFNEASINGITLINETAEYAINARNGNSIAVTDSTIKTSVTPYGWGVYFDSCKTAGLTDSTVESEYISVRGINCENFTVSGCEIKSADDRGICCVDNTSTSISDTTINSAQHGIYANGVTELTVDNATINVTDDDGVAILCTSVTTASIKGGSYTTSANHLSDAISFYNSTVATFYFDPTDYVYRFHTVTANSDGTYTVTRK